jgi:hypothetical protein
MRLVHCDKSKTNSRVPRRCDDGAFVLVCGQAGWCSTSARRLYEADMGEAGFNYDDEVVRAWLAQPVLGDGVIVTSRVSRVTCLMCLAHLAGRGEFAL